MSRFVINRKLIRYISFFIKFVPLYFSFIKLFLPCFCCKHIIILNDYLMRLEIIAMRIFVNATVKSLCVQQ